uniref:Mid2 domain-containing protein n=1 Tax=Talaromyces marneffei PM1 TaxID=1077442 RepID=A0A093VI48_TALMA
MTPHINTSQPSSQLLACALVVSCLAATVQANSSSGTDAPGTNPASGPTTAYNEAGASGNNGGLSKLAQIVIGVVIGVIGLGTIVGAIVFFFRRKKKWDEKIKRYETINAYHNAQREAKRQQAMSNRQQRQRRQRQQERDAEQGCWRYLHFREIKPETLWYPPTTRRLSTNINIAWTLLPEGSHHRQSSSVSNSISAVPPPPPPQKSASKRYKGFGGYSAQVTTSNSEQSVNDSSDAQASSNNQGKLKGLKKPKPALTRLITNL